MNKTKKLQNKSEKKNKNTLKLTQNNNKKC